jgi:AcrR family transcriptional regulator
MSENQPSLREKQKQQTRAEIVRAAFELFGRHGYEDVSVEKISEAAGISRATLFNYFPQKELILREIANSRVEKLKAIVTRFGEDGKKATLADIVGLFVEVAEENVRIAGRSRRLLLNLWFQQAVHGAMMESRKEALVMLSDSIKRIRRRKAADPQLVAETLFAIYMATMLEWLVREDEPGGWLVNAMRERLELALAGVA